MALTEMLKIHMAVHQSISNELISSLQKLGCCQFIDFDSSRVDEVTVAPLRSKMRHIDDLLGEIRFAFRFLEPYATNKVGGLARAFGELPEYSLKELAELASEEVFLPVSTTLRGLEKNLSETRAGMSRLRGIISQLEPLRELAYPLELFSRGTEKVAAAIFTMQADQYGALSAALAEAAGDLCEINCLPLNEKGTTCTVTVIYAREVSEAVADVLDGFSTTKMDVPPFPLTAEEEILSHSAELERLSASEKSIEEEISAVANDAYATCCLCSDHWQIQRAKLEALASGEQTEQISLLSLWLPKDQQRAFDAAIEPFKDLTEVAICEIGEDDTPPSLMQNPGWAAPIETLTAMYGTPTYGKIDPTAIVAPFFYLFFGICFGDAGYGLLLSSLLIFIMVRKQLTGTLRKFFMIMIIGNLMAVAMGVITFSWFGDSITAFPFLSFLKPLGKLQKLDPMNDPMTMLAISLALGFFQIMVGLTLALKENLKRGDKLAAFADQGGWMIFLCGLVLVGLSASGIIGLPTKASALIAAAGALILVATQGREKPSIIGKLFSGILSLYNVTGYLGDVLSYSRLLALGLGSAAVGMVINLLAMLVADTPYVGVLLGALIFIIGHLFSIAVNILGAFVHSLRLQYVEFFGKFYDASGEDFSPLYLSGQYVKISDGAGSPETV